MRMREIYHEPPGYRPPQTVKDFRQRYERGDRYFERARITSPCLPPPEHQRLNLRHADLSEAQLKGTAFSRCDFSHADCTGTDFGKSQFTNCSFAHAKLNGANLYKAAFWFVNFLATDLRGARFLPTVCWRSDHGKQLGQTGRLPSCFISYANADSCESGGLVKIVSDRLIAEGVPHWLQPYSTWLPSKVDLSTYLRREIGNCEVFVLLLTASVPKRPAVALEISRALSLNKRDAAPDIIVVCDDEVVLPERSPYEALARFDPIHCAGGHHDTAAEALIKRLREVRKRD